MSARGKNEKDSLLHDMNSKCASLKTAIGLLRASPPAEARELLTLMKLQARNIAEDIESYESTLPRS